MVIDNRAFVLFIRILSKWQNKRFQNLHKYVEGGDATELYTGSVDIIENATQAGSGGGGGYG